MINVRTHVTDDAVVATARTCGDHRWNMEDRDRIQFHMRPGMHYIGVFDGHGGAEAAVWCRNNLHRRLARLPEYDAQRLCAAFIDADDAYRRHHRTNAGTTIATVIFNRTRMITAHCGDARVVVVNPETVAATVDHKPDQPAERDRIESAGLQVVNWVVPRVLCGTTGIALSRALGDFAFKQDTHRRPELHAITVVPDVMYWPITAQTRFVVCSDGVFEGGAVTTDDIAHIVRRACTPADAARQIVERALKRSTDNITAVVVFMEDTAPTVPVSPVITAPANTPVTALDLNV